MAYAIMINLNYEDYAYTRCRLAWTAIESSLRHQGFRKDGRVFTLNASASKASSLARTTLDTLQQQLISKGFDLHSLIKDFYGYELAHTNNLLMPASDTIRVEEMPLFSTLS